MDTRTVVVDTVQAVRALADTVGDLPASGQPQLYIDIEGVNLCRSGSISIIQVFLPANQTVYLVDVHQLQRAAFDHGLKGILESPLILKAFYDVRNDNDALFSLFQINLAGVVDLQLMELALRPRGGRGYVNGLAKALDQLVGTSNAERQRWQVVKDAGRRLFAPECGGSYQVFNARPMSAAIVAYCTQDVTCMPRMYANYNSLITPTWWARVVTETTQRLTDSRHPAYDGKSRTKAMGPKLWDGLPA